MKDGNFWIPYIRMVKIIKPDGIVNSKVQIGQKKSSQQNNRERIPEKLIEITLFEGRFFLTILPFFHGKSVWQ